MIYEIESILHDVGVGAIYVRRRPRVRLEPVQSGGGQERGMRSGTLPTPLVVGMGAACRIAQEEMEVRNVLRHTLKNTIISTSPV